MIGVPSGHSESMGAVTEAADGFSGGTIALFLILVLISLEIYRTSGSTELHIVKNMYYVVVPLLWVFSLGILYAIVDAL